VDDVTESGNETSERAGAGTVWRVTLAWAVTSQAGRQERVDGLQQLLSARSVVGLMGPGRPTREGLLVDLVLPVQGTRVLIATRDGELEPGAEGEDFAWELHRYTGAVVVNGDLATGDFAVLASEEDLQDEALVHLLDEPLTSAVLLGTMNTGTVEEVADRLGVSGWISDGDRPVLAVQHPDADPTTLVMPGESELSVAVRERAGRVDLLVWGPREDAGTARPTRRRRAAQRTPVVATHLGARCRPVVLPEYKRPAGSAVSELLGRLEEDFAPLSTEALTALGRVLPAARVDALARVVNEAPVRGLDPESGVLAPEEDGLLPGQEPEAEPEREEHADARDVLEALGEDPAWLGLLVGDAPAGRGARPLGDARRDEGLDDAGEPAAASAGSEDGSDGASVAGRAGDKQDPVMQDADQKSGPQASGDGQGAANRGGHQHRASGKNADAATADAAPIAPAIADPGLPLPTLEAAGDRDAAARLRAQDAGGGFASRLHREVPRSEPADFDEVLSAERRSAPKQSAPSVPRPRPAVGTPASSAGDDSAAAPSRGGAVFLFVLGIVLFVAGLGLAVLTSVLGLSTLYFVVAGVAVVLGLIAGIIGLVRLRR